MANLAFSVKVTGMLDYFLSEVEIHINIKIRHGNAFWIKESFKNKLKSERVNIRNAHGISNKRTCTRTTPRPDWNIVLWFVMNIIVSRFRPVYEFPDNKEVTGKTHAEYNAKFVFASHAYFFCNYRVTLSESFFYNVAHVVILVLRIVFVFLEFFRKFKTRQGSFKFRRCILVNR